ncbi:MAG: hypothetical protein E7262_00345 [Lachnospiraceae bacterium]|nr:hypothetical protein [Lachnospiraceae bacterium]
MKKIGLVCGSVVVLIVLRIMYVNIQTYLISADIAFIGCVLFTFGALMRKAINNIISIENSAEVNEI